MPVDAPPLRLNSGLVAIAWVKSIPAVQALADQPPVGRSLPAGNPPPWVANATGFIQLTTVGGTPHPDYALRRPVVQLQAWAGKNSSKLGPWDTAGRLAEIVLEAIYTEHLARAVLQPRVGTKVYQAAQIIEVNARSEPREITGDPSGYARMMFQFELNWVIVP
jgi:hypothetical protein